MQGDHQLNGFGKFLYTQNPFYLISACLVFYGFRVSFGNGLGGIFSPWPLAAALCGYTLLIAVTAFVLIRFGRVWEDARSLVLILLLLFLAISVSFDETCRTDPAVATRVLLLGLCFSALISEALIRGLKIQFPLLYRVPFYLFLSLFFVYPLWVSESVARVSAETISWRIFLFPVFAAVVALTLIPAIHRRAEYVRANGTPWRWPLFPWTVFVFLAFGVCCRSYILSLSFDPQPTAELSSAFGVYFLIPFFFAIVVLITEIAIVERKPGLQSLAFSAAPMLLLLSAPLGKSQVYSGFLGEVVETVGSPTWLTMVALVVYYIVAFSRGIRRSENWLCVVLLLACFVDRRTVGLTTITSVQWWPLLVIGTIQLVRSIEVRSSLRCFLAATCVIVALAIVLRGTIGTTGTVAIAYHLIFFSALAVGAVFEDRYTGLLRLFAATMILASSLGVALVGSYLHIPEVLRIGYSLIVAVACLELWRTWQEYRWLAATAINVAAVLIVGLNYSGEALYHVVGPQGFYSLLFGAVFFIVAGLISAQKCGMLQKLWLMAKAWSSSDTGMM